MFSFENASSQLFAAVASLAVSALVFATAIAPANQGAILPGVLA
ncbi:MAG: recombination protein F [Sphingomonadaceae bacterium]|nr:recombination protein F [Sphingomonadaceae bacterium]MCP5383419.1 recombination protein F [Altererythrobacter sp.]MCP5392052.1 recombination protein F [Sphingomonadaceae bacterium]